MINSHTPTHFTPSSTDLLAMIASAERKFAHAQEQAILKKEAQESAISARAWDAEVKARFYFRIQHGLA
jgi:hypothetical protein